MPTYDYICSNCQRTTEIRHSINGIAPAACPACGALGTLSKAFNPPTIHFKGSGWAKKDRSGASSKPTRSSESPESSEATEKPAPGSGESSSGSGPTGDSNAKPGDAKPKPAAARGGMPPSAPATSAD